MRKNLLLLFIFCSFFSLSNAQLSTWQKADWFDIENPYRKMIKDKNGNQWENRMNTIIRITSTDTTIFNIPVSNVFGADISLTSTGRIYGFFAEGTFTIKDNQVSKITIPINYYHYPFGDKMFFYTKTDLYSKNDAGVSTTYTINDGPSKSYTNRQIISDDSTFMALITLHDSLHLNEYDEVNDTWKNIKNFKNTSKYKLHKKSKSIYIYTYDSLFIYQKGKPLVKLATNDPILGARLSEPYFTEQSEKVFFNYQNGLRTWDNGFTNYKFSDIQGFEAGAVLSYYPINFSQTANYNETYLGDGKVIFRIDSMPGTVTANKKSYVFLYDGQVIKYVGPFTYNHNSTTKTPIIAHYLQDGNITNYHHNLSNMLKVYYNGSEKVTIQGMVLDNMRIGVSGNYLWLYDGLYNLYKMRHDNYFVSGTVFYDANKNGYKDFNEYGTGKVALKIAPSGLIVYPNKYGYYAFGGSKLETYTISVTGKYENDFEAIPPITVTSNTNNNIALKTNNQYLPEAAVFVRVGRSRCDEITYGGFSFMNTGFVDIDSASVAIDVDNDISIAPIDVTDPANKSLQFKIEKTLVQGGSNYSFKVKWPSGANIGKQFLIHSTTKLYKGGGIVKEFSDSTAHTLFCSFDPNDKSVMPRGINDEHYTLKEWPLDYTIRFENTGNDVAYNVTITDTLDKDLDWSSFELLSSSHNVITHISSKGVVTFNFTDINLPDSTSNKEASDGFLKYRINVKESIQDFTVVDNKAYIVFDKNAPIVTNQTINTMVTEFPVLSSINEGVNDNSSHFIYPNPASGIINFNTSANASAVQIKAMDGKTLYRGNDSSVSINTYSTGVYIVQMIGKDGEVLQSERLVIYK